MKPDIRILPYKILVGKRVTTTVATDRPETYWRPFKMNLKAIDNANTERFYSVQTFDRIADMNQFNHETEFEKWAAAEVSEIGNVPEGLEVFNFDGGKYAMFVHKGTAADFNKTMNTIYGEWLPNSNFELDNRPHITIMPADHRPDDPNAEELVCVPIR